MVSIKCKSRYIDKQTLQSTDIFILQYKLL